MGSTILQWHLSPKLNPNFLAWHETFQTKLTPYNHPSSILLFSQTQLIASFLPKSLSLNHVSLFTLLCHYSITIFPRICCLKLLKRGEKPPYFAQWFVVCPVLLLIDPYNFPLREPCRKSCFAQAHREVKWSHIFLLAKTEVKMKYTFFTYLYFSHNSMMPLPSSYIQTLNIC